MTSKCHESIAALKFLKKCSRQQILNKVHAALQRKHQGFEDGIWKTLDFMCTFYSSKNVSLTRFGPHQQVLLLNSLISSDSCTNMFIYFRRFLSSVLLVTQFAQFAGI